MSAPVHVLSSFAKVTEPHISNSEGCRPPAGWDGQAGSLGLTGGGESGVAPGPSPPAFLGLALGLSKAEEKEPETSSWPCRGRVTGPGRPSLGGWAGVLLGPAQPRPSWAGRPSQAMSPRGARLLGGTLGDPHDFGGMFQ